MAKSIYNNQHSPSTPPVQTLSPLTPISPWPSLPEDPASPTIPPSEQVPNATDVYASIAILGTYLLFGLYLFWAFSPKDSKWTGWLPDREWAVIVPCWLMMVVLLTYWTYAALMLYNTPSFSSPDCITDPYSNIPCKFQDTQPYYWKYAKSDAIPDAVDLPIDLVQRTLYQPHKRHLGKDVKGQQSKD
nr:phosphatidylinositol glycan, class P [Cryptococcus depauperatus CBS 7841]